MIRRILLCFSNAHLKFGFDEFEALACVYGIRWCEHVYPKLHSERTKRLNVVRVVECSASDEELKKVLNRSVTIRFACELLCDRKDSYADLHETMKTIPGTSGAKDTWERFRKESFCFRLTTICAKRKQSYLLNRIEEFDYLPLEGPVRMKNPDNTFYLIELHKLPLFSRKASGSENDSETGSEPSEPVENDSTLLDVYLGRLIGKGNWQLPSKFDLETRHFIGNTSMDPTLSLIQANLSGVKDGSFVCDPYVGTGSLIIAAAHYGAYCVGTEISYKVLHGIGKSSRSNVKYRGPNENVKANFDQYGITDKYVGVMIADSSRAEVWREQPLFDAIIADPPYGIREKGAKLGSRNGAEVPKDVPRLPGKVQYEYEDTYLDLLNFASKYLVIGGRLSFWLPFLLDKFKEEHIPRHAAFSLLHNCEQRLSGVYGRRLIVMRKEREAAPGDAKMPENPFSDLSLRDTVLPKSSSKYNQHLQNPPKD